jgi:NAD(P)-dependent dehydrogenase (short-subunit alcohol dehydrogenase family)
MTGVALRDRVALVTGAGGGIGAATAARLAAAGAVVVLADVDERALERVALPPGATALRVPLDVRDAGQWRRAVDQVTATYGRLDVLVNNAGVIEPGPVDALPVAEIERQLDVNLLGTILGCREALRVMRPRGAGRIVNIASMGAIIPMPWEAAYCASKYGVRGFTFALHAELRGSGVGVCAVCLDSVDTGQLRHELAFPEAALSFADAALSAAVAARAVVRAIGTRKPEMLVPPARGLLARIAMAFPRLVLALLPWLRRSGARRQARLRGSAPGSGGTSR